MRHHGQGRAGWRRATRQAPHRYPAAATLTATVTTGANCHWVSTACQPNAGSMRRAYLAAVGEPAAVQHHRVMGQRVLCANPGAASRRGPAPARRTVAPGRVRSPAAPAPPARRTGRAGHGPVPRAHQGRAAHWRRSRGTPGIRTRTRPRTPAAPGTAAQGGPPGAERASYADLVPGLAARGPVPWGPGPWGPGRSTGRNPGSAGITHAPPANRGPVPGPWPTWPDTRGLHSRHGRTVAVARRQRARIWRAFDGPVM